MMDRVEADQAVTIAARRAHDASPSLANASEKAVNVALRVMATRLTEASESLLAANQADLEAAAAANMSTGLTDRLRLDADRLATMANQLNAIADLESKPSRVTIGQLPDGLLLQEWSRPIGVVGANFEARPNVVVDIASQLI